MTASPLIEARALHRRFDDGVEALRGVDLSIAAGEFVAIQGPSGCGKSTLLHLLGGLDRPTAGDVRFEWESLSLHHDLAKFRSRTVGFVFQASRLLSTLSALENVQVPMFEMPWPASERERRASELIGAVGLGDRSRHRPSRLSGGERQRVAVARSLANEPRVLLADEPTGNLDSANAAEVITLLKTLHDTRGITLVIVTHDPVVAAAASRVIHMRDGRIAS